MPVRRVVMLVMITCAYGSASVSSSFNGHFPTLIDGRSSTRRRSGPHPANG